MNVICLVAQMRCASNRFGFAAAVLGLAAFGPAAPLLVGGCGGKAGSGVEQTRMGRVELNLLAAGSQGNRYRLRDAVIMVQGPDSTLFFDSEENLDASSLVSLLPAGAYTSFLQEGWWLERVDSGERVGNVALSSPNPDSFEVLGGGRTRLALRFQVDADEVVAVRGLLEIAVEVEEPPSSSTLCSSDADCGGEQVCCIAGRYGTCQSLEADRTCPLPDLTVSEEAAAATLLINDEVFPPGSCAIEEGCVSASGKRRLLRFATMTPNVGEADLVLGRPEGTPGFEYATCHGHYHFEGYARYELVAQDGAVAATGHKQAFCLLDSTPVGLPGASTTPRFHCEFQGIQRGWADMYDAALDCQWVDITDIPGGEYRLRISINPDRIIAESNFDNNTVEIPVTVADPSPAEAR
jgi:hypothetical protein